MAAANTSADTPKKHPNLAPAWKPGQSGNPAGRPKGARTKLGEAFCDALLADFSTHGVQAIIDMREEKAADYVKVIAAVLPKEIDLGEETQDALASIIMARREKAKAGK